MTAAGWLSGDPAACGREHCADRLAALRRRPWWESAGLAAVIGLTAFMYIWKLSQNDTGNALLRRRREEWIAELEGFPVRFSRPGQLHHRG